jgi:hypothetical protein
MGLSSYVLDALHEDAGHEDAGLAIYRATTERARARVYVSYVSTGGVAVKLSHRLTAASRSLPAE